MTNHKVEIYGHRGFRGKFPENTILGFIKAIELGISGLELDVVVCADGQLLVSHEPFMHHETCAHPDASPILESEARDLNIFRMTATEAQNYKCGSFPHPNFKDQVQIEGFKPLLSEVLSEIQFFCIETRQQFPTLNIEIKSAPKCYGSHQPHPKELASLVHHFLLNVNYGGKMILQTFDVQLLEEMNKLKPQIELGLIIEHGQPSVIEQLVALSFYPNFCNLQYTLLSPNLVEFLRFQDITIFTWTVNTQKELETAVSLGVNKIITDFPDEMLAWTKTFSVSQNHPSSKA